MTFHTLTPPPLSESGVGSVAIHLLSRLSIGDCPYMPVSILARFRPTHISLLACIRPFFTRFYVNPALTKAPCPASLADGVLFAMFTWALSVGFLESYQTRFRTSGGSVALSWTALLLPPIRLSADGSTLERGP